MKKAIILAVFLMVPGLTFSGCSAPKGETEAAPVDTPKTVAVETVHPTMADMNRGVDVVGTLAPKFETSVKSEYLGIVEEVYVAEWVRVKKGTALARLDTREASSLLKKMQAAVEMAKAGLLEAEASGLKAEREYERSLKLLEYGLITRQQLDDAGTAKSAAQARVTAAQAQLRSVEEDLRQTETRFSKAVIRAPMDGIVSQRSANVGDLVGEVGSPRVMFKIVDNSLLDLTVTVPSYEMEMIKVGQPLEFSTDAFRGKTFMGRVKFINPLVNESDRSVQVVAEVANVPEILKGGMFVQGKIITGKRQKTLLLPRTAFMSLDEKNNTGDLLVAVDNTVQRRRVKTGIIGRNAVEIIDGLTAGEAVITRGAFAVKDGDRVTVAGPRGGN